MLVQALVPQLAVEALQEAVLLRLARRDVVPFDAVLLGPLKHGIAGELGAVVEDDHLRLAALGHDPIEHAGNPRTGQRGIDLGGSSSRVSWSSTLNTPEAPARLLEHVRHEVEHPNLVRSMRPMQRRPRADRALAATSPANRKSFLAIKPVDLLHFMHCPWRFLAISRKLIAEPASFGRQRTQQFTSRRVVLALLAERTADRSTPQPLAARRCDSP